MPRRKTVKCESKGAGKLHPREETNLVLGHCWGFGDIESRSELSQLWTRWGEALTERWAEAFPGSRPVCAYLVGGLPLWETAKTKKFTRTLDGKDVFFDELGHQDLPELEHLEAEGLLFPGELELAKARLEEPYPNAFSRYVPLHRD